MGSGASAEALKSASVPDVKAFIAEMPPEVQEKVRVAVQSASAADASDKFSVPEKVSMCDEKWLTTALRKGGLLDESTSVANTNVKIMGADEGLTSDTALIELSYAGEGSKTKAAPVACVVKLRDRSSKMPEAFVRNMFQAEIDIYRYLAADFAKKGFEIPKMFFSCCPEDPSASAEDFVMVMEHMTHPSRQPPMQVGSVATGVSLESALLAVKGLAALHSVYWGMGNEAARALEIAPGKPKFPKAIYGHCQDQGKLNTYATQLKQRVCGIPAIFGPDGSAKLDPDDAAIDGFRNIGAVLSSLEPVVKRRLSVFVQRIGTCPVALAHADCHCENLFVGRDEPAAMWFDFGTFNFRPAVFDVAMFTITSIEADLRASNEEKIVKCYHDELLAKGVENYSFEQCLSDVRFSTFIGIWNIGGLLLMMKEAVASEKNPIRFKANILVKRAAAALEAVRWAELFKDTPEDSEEQHPLEADKPLNFE